MPKESDTEQLREGFEILEKNILKSKELVDTGTLAKVIDNLHQRVEINKNLIGILQGKVFDLWETKPQEPPVSSSEDEVYVVVERSSIKGALASHTFSGKGSLKDAKGHIQAMKGIIGNRRIARLVFLDEEKKECDHKGSIYPADDKNFTSFCKRCNQAWDKPAIKAWRKNEKRPEVL